MGHDLVAARPDRATVAIDLPGFGQSERRAELLSPRAMGRFLLRLVDEWELGRPHLVGPDIGTGAVLFAAAEDLDRFPSAVVGAAARHSRWR